MVFICLHLRVITLPLAIMTVVIYDKPIYILPQTDTLMVFLKLFKHSVNNQSARLRIGIGKLSMVTGNYLTTGSDFFIRKKNNS